MRGVGRGPVVPAPGERVLAWADSDRGPVGGTRDALYLPVGAAAGGGTLRLPWTRVEGADWDVETQQLRVRELGTFGAARPEHVVVLPEPGRLLELVRERVTATVVLSRRVLVTRQRSVTLVGRRETSGERPVTWFVEYDAGLDPDDPLVVLAVEAALTTARGEVGQP